MLIWKKVHIRTEACDNRRNNNLLLELAGTYHEC